MPNKLGRLWVAFRHLSSVPFVDKRYSNFKPLWHELWGQWSRAAAWYGLHGHLFLGRLAALTSVRDIYEYGGTGAQFIDSIHTTSGAVASELYSIAKRVTSLRLKTTLRQKALHFVQEALDEKQSEQSGLLAIRGSIYLSFFRIGRAVADYERVVRLRQEAGETPNRIGEAEADLGMAYFWQGKIHKARNLLEAGVAKLESSGDIPFTIRALRKLCLFHILTFKRKEASAIYDRANALASKHEVGGQTLQLNTLRRLLLR